MTDQPQQNVQAGNIVSDSNSYLQVDATARPVNNQSTATEYTTVHR